MDSNLRLCYIGPDGDQAWFTNQPRDDVWGDDWDELPCQASGPPHQVGGFEWLELRFESDLMLNSGPTVDDINGEMFDLCWMDDWNGEPAIRPWMSVRDFVDTVRKFGGKVFMPFEGF